MTDRDRFPRGMADFFGETATAVILREEARFGEWDARTGLPLRNYYSSRLTGSRLAAYQGAYRAVIAARLPKDAARG